MEITNLKTFIYDLSSLITDLEINKGHSAQGIMKKTLNALKRSLKSKEKSKLNSLINSLLIRLEKIEKEAEWELAELREELDMYKTIYEV